MIYNHYFEYQYVWQHSSKSLPTRYMISCFWEGQEGSFLLWIFWNILLGLILIRTTKKWEAPVLTIVSTIQAFLSSMLIGIYIANIKIGSSPFVLVRNLDENIGLPWTQMENYLQIVPQFMDGRGLNPLLQNYWMVIHPPNTFSWIFAYHDSFLLCHFCIMEKRIFQMDKSSNSMGLCWNFNFRNWNINGRCMGIRITILWWILGTGTQ